MPDNEDRSLISLPDGSLANTAVGAQRIVSAMVGEMLALTRQEQASIQSAKRKIGDYEFCDPDYRQISLWAVALSLAPEEVIKRLLDRKSMFHCGVRMASHRAGTDFKDGRITGLHWDLQCLPLEHFEWIEGLSIDHLSFFVPYGSRRSIAAMPLHFPELFYLSCDRLGLTQLDLSHSAALEELECGENLLTQLDLSFVPRLKVLEVGSNALAELDLSFVPNLINLVCSENMIRKLPLALVPQLQELWCSGNGVIDLDLAAVPHLKHLSCEENQLTWLDLGCTPQLEWLECEGNPIAELDVRSLENLHYLGYDSGQTRLIRRADQDFVCHDTNTLDSTRH